MIWNPQIELIEGDRHRELLRLAYSIAANDSEDPVTQVGAIVVEPDMSLVMGWGANQVPQEIHDQIGTEEVMKRLQDKQWKYAHIIHAEEAAITNAESWGNNLEGAIMYLPWVPCNPCADLIINAGISKIIGHKEMIMQTPERWYPSIEKALKDLEDAGIERYMLTGKLHARKIMFSGKIWEP